MAWYRWQGDDLLIALRVQPRAGRTAFGELHGDERKVRLQAPPLDGRANQELIRFIADSFGVRRDQVTLVAGTRGRSKLLRIESPSKLPPEARPGPQPTTTSGTRR
jgi:uncharacterized protein (TIGR00251 family)